MTDTGTVESTGKTDTAGESPDTAPTQDLRKKFSSEILKIPCMRTSLLNGYIGAVVGGLAGFFYSSKAKIGWHSAFTFYWITATVTWISCRYKLEKEKQLWVDLNRKRMEVKQNEYNIPTAVEKLLQKTGDSDSSTTAKDS